MSTSVRYEIKQNRQINKVFFFTSLALFLKLVLVWNWHISSQFMASLWAPQTLHNLTILTTTFWDWSLAVPFQTWHAHCHARHIQYRSLSITLHRGCPACLSSVGPICARTMKHRSACHPAQTSAQDSCSPRPPAPQSQPFCHEAEPESPTFRHIFRLREQRKTPERLKWQGDVRQNMVWMN